MSWNDMIYEYDGTYEGFLCCIFESYVNKEFPIAFVSNEEFPVLSLYSVRAVVTDSLTLAPPSHREAEYRKLWKTFFDTVAIRERHNERCQNTFLPKRYRSTMTEFQSETVVTPEASPADALPPFAPDAIPAPATPPILVPPAPGSCT